MNSVIWPAIGAAAASLYTVAFVYSLLMLSRQLRAQSFSEAYERLQAEDVRAARGVLYELDERNVTFENWKDDESVLRAVEKVCQRFDYFATMVRWHFLPKKLVLDLWAVQVERLWKVAKPFVRSRRATPGQGRLWEDFQWLAHESSRWRSKRSRKVVLRSEE